MREDTDLKGKRGEVPRGRTEYGEASNREAVCPATKKILRRGGGCEGGGRKREKGRNGVGSFPKRVS